MAVRVNGGVVIRRMERAVERGDSNARNTIEVLVKVYKGAKSAVEAGYMSQTEFNEVHDWVVLSRSIYVKAMRLVTDHGFDEAYLAGELAHVTTLYALAGCELGDWAREALRTRFSEKPRMLRRLDGMVNAAQLAKARLPYPFPDGRFKLLEKMSSTEAHLVFSSVSLSVRPEVMRRMKGDGRREAMKAVVTSFTYEMRDGRRVGVLRGQVVKTHQDIVIDDDNVASVRKAAGFAA